MTRRVHYQSTNAPELFTLVVVSAQQTIPSKAVYPRRTKQLVVPILQRIRLNQLKVGR